MDQGHLQFKTHWRLSEQGFRLLGECVALARTLKDAPLTPNVRQYLMTVALKRGALATTAIEGNSVTDEEYDDFVERGRDLPPSRDYQQREVKNILGAFNHITDEILGGNMNRLMTPEMILYFHRLVTGELGDAVQAVPGQFRRNNVTVGTYRPPNYADIPKLMDRYCAWLENFGYTRDQTMDQAIIEAIVAHVYFEWIHPFGDGNGRTGRLVEFYVLMRAGLPLIAGHILSNFYNSTRDKYYRTFDQCRHKADLTDFLEYALEGFRDGLTKTWESVQKSQVKVLWQRIIYDAFDDQAGAAAPRKRKRSLALHFPMDEGLSIAAIAKRWGYAYQRLSSKTLRGDVRELVDKKLLRQEESRYYANWRLACSDYFDPSRERPS